MDQSGALTLAILLAVTACGDVASDADGGPARTDGGVDGTRDDTIGDDFDAGAGEVDAAVGDSNTDIPRGDFGIARGTIRTSITDLDVEGAAVRHSFRHWRDVDEMDDQCIRDFKFEVRLIPDHCTVHLSFGFADGSAERGLTELRIETDSLCPDFPNGTEGTYEMEGYAPIWL